MRMCKEPLVSILVAIYNVEPYLKRCIESIIAQDYKNLEIILVDDCSTDASGNICDKFSTVDNRIIVIHHEKNTKLPGVRNTGINNASGDFIIFVDGDDWLAIDFVSYMLSVINTTQTDIAINLVNFTSSDRKQVSPRDVTIWESEKVVAAVLFPNISIGAWNKIYRRSFIDKYDLRFQEDLFTAEGMKFVTDACQRTKSIGVGYRKVYYYRINNANSATKKYDVRQSLGALYAISCIEKDLILDTPLIRYAIKRQYWFNHFWNIRQILGTDTLSLNKKNYNTSINYIKNNYWNIIKKEDRYSKKIKYLLTGFAPVLAAKVKNFIVGFNLQKDILMEKNKK